MEEDREMKTFFNEFKDQLVTVQDFSIDTKQMWLACGFNGFGQLVIENKQSLSQFEGNKFSWRFLLLQKIDAFSFFLNCE